MGELNFGAGAGVKPLFEGDNGTGGNFGYEISPLGELGVVAEFSVIGAAKAGAEAGAPLMRPNNPPVGAGSDLVGSAGLGAEPNRPNDGVEAGFSSAFLPKGLLLVEFSPIFAVLPNNPLLAVEDTFPNNPDEGVLCAWNVMEGTGVGGVLLVEEATGANAANGFFLTAVSSFFATAAGTAGVGGVDGVFAPNVNFGGATGVVELLPNSPAPGGFPTGVLLMLAKGLLFTGDAWLTDGAGDPMGVPPPFSAPNPANGLLGVFPKIPPLVPFDGAAATGCSAMPVGAVGDAVLKSKESCAGTTGRAAAGIPEKRDLGCLMLQSHKNPEKFRVNELAKCRDVKTNAGYGGERGSNG